MKFKDLLILSTRTFKTNTSRTALTVLGLGVGIGAVFFLVSLGYGLQNVILSNITTADSILTLDVSSGSNLVVLDKTTVESINKMPTVAETSPLVSLAGQLVSDASISDGLINLVDKPYFRLSGLKIATGREFTNNDSPEIVVSSAAAKIFGFTKATDIIGQNLKINLFIPGEDNEAATVASLDSVYTVVGIVNDENSNFIYAPINTASKVNLPPYSGLRVKVTSEENLSVARDLIVHQGFMVSSLSDTIDQTKKIFAIIQIVLAVFGLIALIVSAIGMFNTMTITLLERTQEIGIMRSIGVTNHDVASLFLLESLIMGFLGGCGGLLIGYVFGELFNISINIMAKNFGGQSFDLFYRPGWFVVFVLLFSVLTGFLTGLYPARRAAKLNPLDALRYK
ncbi:MAG: ABC transporter permease [Candidatus Falkowbacteria bacterium]